MERITGRRGWALWLVACLPLSATAEPPVQRDDARVLSASGRELYRETHWVMAGGGRWVTYQCGDGAPFARKRVQPRGAAAAPDFALDDGRDGYREGVRSERGSRVAYVQEKGKPESGKRLQVPADGVVDAGFDAAVRAAWPRLVRGDAVRMQFLVPSRQRFFPVRVQRVASIDWNGIPAERLRMRLDAWFGFAIPDVTLVYGRTDRRLLEFAGTGNIRDARGRNPQVRIAFEPKRRAASAGEFDAAMRAPLTGRCVF